MMDFPREVRAGDKISATEYNKMVRLVRSLYPVQGPGVNLRRTPVGTVFSAQQPAASPSAAAGGVPMPFDLKGEVETSDDGTQKRLKVYFSTTGADVIWNGYRLVPNTNVNTGWDLAYVGEWTSAESFTASATMWLWFETLFQQEFADGQWRCSFEGDWEVYEEANLSDLGQMGVIPDGSNYVEQNVPLGLVTASGDKVTVAQYFHGVLMLHDTSFIWNQDGGGGGGGGGGETTDTGCYAINSSNKLINQYFIRGGVVETTNFTGDISGYKGLILALKISATPGGSVSLASYASVGELAAASRDRNYIITPLYQFASDGTVAVDFRNAPRAQTVEIL